jgi:hypothetical protein
MRRAFLREGAIDFILKRFDRSSFERVCSQLIGGFPEPLRSRRPPVSLAPRAAVAPETVADRRP